MHNALSLQPFLGAAGVGQGFLRLTLADQFSDGAQPMAHIMALHAHGFLYLTHGLRALLQPTQLQHRELGVMARLHLTAQARNEDKKNEINPHHHHTGRHLDRCDASIGQAGNPGQKVDHHQIMSGQEAADQPPAMAHDRQLTQRKRSQIAQHQPELHATRKQEAQPHGPELSARDQHKHRAHLLDEKTEGDCRKKLKHRLPAALRRQIHEQRQLRQMQTRRVKIQQILAAEEAPKHKKPDEEQKTAAIDDHQRLHA